MAGRANFPTVCKETLADLAREQKPFATILGCSDARVPPELIFDANFGELFIVRVAGNVISPEVMGIRSVPGGCSRFSRCCYLIIDLSSPLFGGGGPQDLVAVTWTRRMSSAARQYTRLSSSLLRVLLTNRALAA